MITPERLAQIEAEANAATEGPWEAAENHIEVRGCLVAAVQPHGNVRTVMTTGEQYSHADATFIANARQNIPDLVAEVRRLQAANARAITMATDYQALAAHREDEIGTLRAAIARADEEGAAAIERAGQAIIAQKWNSTTAFQERALKAEAENARLNVMLDASAQEVGRLQAERVAVRAAFVQSGTEPVTEDMGKLARIVVEQLSEEVARVERLAQQRDRLADERDRLIERIRRGIV